MNELIKVPLLYYNNAEKEPILFFLLQAYFLALVCYDFELDCCLKKALHNCKACLKKRVQTFVLRMLGWPSAEKMEVCLAQKAELETKVVQYEKYLWEIKDTFVKTQNQIALMEGLFKEIEEEDSFYFVEEEEIEDMKDVEESFYFVEEVEEEEEGEENNEEEEEDENGLLELDLLEAQNMMLK
ncbi:hypothetical protein BD770DRAFT_468346 [Pilaira anomala]|nr:hypothetical protein BD770DRAFT_468346 [Pilaira anomala]